MHGATIKIMNMCQIVFKDFSLFSYNWCQQFLSKNHQYYVFSSLVNGTQRRGTKTKKKTFTTGYIKYFTQGSVQFLVTYLCLKVIT